MSQLYDSRSSEKDDPHLPPPSDATEALEGAKPTKQVPSTPPNNFGTNCRTPSAAEDYFSAFDYRFPASPNLRDTVLSPMYHPGEMHPHPHTNVHPQPHVHTNLHPHPQLHPHIPNANSHSAHGSMHLNISAHNIPMSGNPNAPPMNAPQINASSSPNSVQVGSPSNVSQSRFSRPLQHVRSASYTPLESAYRLNLTLKMPSQLSRPRAVSSSYPNKPHLGGSPTFEQHMNAFPPPLSSPVSPEDNYHRRNLSEHLMGSMSSGLNSVSSVPSISSMPRQFQLPGIRSQLGGSVNVNGASGLNGSAGGPVSGLCGPMGSTYGPASTDLVGSGTPMGTTMGTTMGTPMGSVGSGSSAGTSMGSPMGVGSVGSVGSGMQNLSLNPVPFARIRPTHTPSASMPAVPVASPTSFTSSKPKERSVDHPNTHTSSHSQPHNQLYPPSPLVSTSPELSTMSKEDLLLMCQDQKGCRFLQRRICQDEKVVSQVFDAAIDHITQLMVDPFGNYFCQKLFENCNNDQVTRILDTSKGSLSSIAVNQHGTRALQKLIERVNTTEQIEILVNSLSNHVVQLIRDLNGNHVIQKILLVFPERHKRFIFVAVSNAVFEVGSHRHGCCVLQRCLAYAAPHHQKMLVERIIEESLPLVLDPFGNYVCQYVIDLKHQKYTDAMAHKFLGRILNLSVQKFSSNVVEKVLRSGSGDVKRKIIVELMVPKNMHELLLDNYGNYVIQTALDVSYNLGPDFRQDLVKNVQLALGQTKSPYGRRIMSKLK